MATEQVEEGNREPHVRVDSEERRFSPVPINRPVQQPSTDKRREPKRSLHWCVICSAPLVDLSRWIKPVPCSEERARSRLETSPVRRLTRDKLKQEVPMECHR